MALDFRGWCKVWMDKNGITEWPSLVHRTKYRVWWEGKDIDSAVIRLTHEDRLPGKRKAEELLVEV